jgi:cytochrome c-type biogenesis protein CcmF
MGYIGEHLLPGKFGHFFIVLSLVASLIAAFSYFRAARSINQQDAAYWKKLARTAFLIEAVSVIAIFSILFYIIHNHYFEYKYAWQHSSLSLEFKYLLACFWEGQEGSFMLWSFWHCALGVIIIVNGKKWEAPVMTVLSIVQFCLATMIAGIYIFSWKMGSNPFILLRDSGVLDNAPAYHMDFDVTKAMRPDYLLSIRDGNDLNPLLQNYWMVIHPPVLFLGFASTIIPFAYAISPLWTKRRNEALDTSWTRPALPWALFSGAVLGVGIMMGAMWAYESLTFGGYWAWDPVENASLVPWLVMIAGIHTLLIYKHSGHSLRTTHLFFILSFCLVLYSTYLTRSGVLDNSSVHSFTDQGMKQQLIAFLLIGVIPGLVLFMNRYKDIPAVRKEESTSSREFWMFIGSLVFFLSALLIIGKTSLPVFNKIFNQKIAPPEEPELAYNRIQIFVAIIIATLTAVVQYLRYKQTPLQSFWKKIWKPTLITLAIAIPVIALGDIHYMAGGPVFLGAIWLGVGCSIYTVIANASYIWLGLKGNLKLSGGSIAHLGFGMVLVGILLSSSKKEILSYNTSGIAISFGEDSEQKSGENLTLVKGLSTDMGKYWVTYESDSAHPKKQLWFYNIRFKSKDGKEEFVLQPNAFVNYKGNEGLMANPSSRHYWDHDVFTYITSLPNPEKQKDKSVYKPHLVKAGDTIFYSNGYMVLGNIVSKDNLPSNLFGPNDRLYEAPVKVFSRTGSISSITPKLAIVKNEALAIPDTIVAENMIIRFQKINEDNRIEIGVKESEGVMQYVTLKAYKFPFINLLWLGVVITAIGIIMSMIRRISLNRKGLTNS